MMSNFKYIEKRILISVKNSHIANFESGLDRALVRRLFFFIDLKIGFKKSLFENMTQPFIKIIKSTFY